MNLNYRREKKRGEEEEVGKRRGRMPLRKSLRMWILIDIWTIVVKMETNYR